MINFTYFKFLVLNKEGTRKWLLVSLFLLFSLSGFSQTNISGIVNSYFSVTAINQPVCAPCDLSCNNTITVSNASGLSVGDKALIIQMKGANINVTNTTSGGNITAINNTGNYEFFEIKSIAGNVITPVYPLIKSYTIAGFVQVVRVPKYTGTVNINGTLTAKDWVNADRTGGVLAIQTDRLTFNANIDVAGKGYQGIQMLTNGPNNDCTINPNTQYVQNSAYTASFTKGDGIVIDNTNANRGRSPRANGGGSGVAGDSGGGGGSNFGAGGEGGKRWCDVNGLNAGGIGGVSLTSYFAQDKVFLGGAGGSGYVTTGNPSTAADGGGIVIIFANEIVGNGYSIIADGFSPSAVNPSGAPDGGGGGGAGGTVVLKTPLFTGNLTVSAKGGDGQDLNTNTYHGPGGGGGGGALLYSLASLPANVTLTSIGGIGGQHLDGQRNGSQNGSIGGSVSLYIPIENPNYEGNQDNDGLNVDCDLDDDNDGILDTVEIGSLPDPFADADGDKKVNYIDSDAPGFIDINSDGIDDRYDEDLDGIINQLDLDSDNDGCPDAVEAYGTTTADPDSNGYYGTGNPPATNATDGKVTSASYSAPVNTTGTSKPNYLVRNSVAITTSPGNQTINSGTNVTFNSVVTGTHIVYTWKQSTDGTTWTTVTDGGTVPAFSNATTNSLTLTNVPFSYNNYQYRVDVTSTSNVCTQLSSNTATLSVVSVNNNPVAVNDNYTVAEDATVTLTPLALDSDVDGDVLTITSINGTALTGGVQTISVTNGTVSISATNVITFTAGLNYNGAISFPYVISDGHGGTATANELITVTPVNDNPVAVNDNYTVAEDATLTLTPLALDSDVDGDTLTITSINGTTLTGGVQSISVTNGTVNISATNVITFTAGLNYNGAISFPYVISDGHGGTATANELITVTPINDNPVAVNDNYTVAEDATVTLTPLALDSDVDGDTLTITSINGTTLTGGVQSISVTNGTVNISATNVITFTAGLNYNGAISFPYVISDGHSGTATANELITVTQVNDNPVAVNDNYTVAEDATVTLTPLALDSDVDGDTLTIISINGTALTAGAQTITVTNGTVTISATNVITFTAGLNYNGAISFPYVISDGHGGTATANELITVTPVNDNPVAVNDTYTVSEGATVTLTPLALDSDVDGDTLTIISINGTALTGGVQTISVTNGTVNISATGVITFTPTTNFNSATAISIPYVISDGHGGTATANELITVTPINDNPVAVNDNYTVAEDSTVTLTPLALDSDVDGDTLTITSINGTTLTGGVQTISVTNGTVNISATNVITFTAGLNYNGAISFPYVISDGHGGTATANELITVTPVNDNPVSVNDNYTVAEDATLTLTPLALDSDVDGDTLTIISINGTALTGGVQTISVTNGTVNISATGVITFTPTTNFNSATAISIPYVISDGHGGTATANELITVTPVNDNPVAVNDNYTVAEDATVTLTPLALDSDVDGDVLTITSINGTTLTGGAQTISVTNGTVNISATGVITFTPTTNFNSATAISIPYVISDGHGGTATANELITFTPVNDNPVAVNDNYTVAEDATVTLTPLALDSDVDGDTLTITSINGTTLTGGVQTISVTNGTVSISATNVITFTAGLNYNGAISFPYVISDGHGGTATANELITVTPVNDAPVANNDTNTPILSTAGETPINALTATDIDGTIASYTVLSLPVHGVLRLLGVPVIVNQVLTTVEAGKLTYDPSGIFTGNDTFTFTATDDLGAVALSTATIIIPVANNAPIAHDDTNTGIPSRAEATAINALTATDTDGTIVNYTVLSLPVHGTLALAGTPVIVNQVLTPLEAGNLTYDPSGAFSGNDTFTFTATDNNGAIDVTPAVITIVVEKTILEAISDPMNSVVGIDKVVTVLNVFDNDTLNNNPLVPSDVDLKVLTPDPNGVLILKSDGTAELVPNAPAANYLLVYEICEKANPGNCSSATVSVSVVAPTMTITVNSYCSKDTPYVSYNVVADNFTPTGLLTINWIDSANNIVATQTNMPLSGDVLWPGATVDSNNNPIDWPGWVLSNGQWTQGNDGFELTRPAVTMQFTLNPTKSVVVNYPAATSGCNARPTFGIHAGNEDDVTLADGINGSLQVINVLDNDKLNGVAVIPSEVVVKGINLPTGITLNSDGTIDVAPGTEGGSHTLNYQICEVANPDNCSTATVKIFVEIPAVAIIKTVKLNDSNGNEYAEAGETLTYSFVITNTGNVDLENLSVSDPLTGIVMNGGPINLSVGQSDDFSITGTYTLTQADVNAGSISNQATVSGTTKSGIVVSDKSDSSNLDGEKPTVINLDGCVIKIFNALSINGDQKNERFYIQGLECYPDNTVQIFNRWGVLVFERDHYNNNDIAFRGISEGRVTVKDSNGLPEGTYYYIIRYKDKQSNAQQEAGYLYLTK